MGYEPLPTSVDKLAKMYAAHEGKSYEKCKEYYTIQAELYYHLQYQIKLEDKLV